VPRSHIGYSLPFTGYTTCSRNTVLRVTVELTVRNTLEHRKDLGTREAFPARPERPPKSELCKINNWKKIGPMPRSYAEVPLEEGSAEVLKNPIWTLMPWSKEEMQALMHRRFSKKDLAGVDLDWIESPQMNLTAVINLQRPTIPKHPLIDHRN
jgi:hypothetical protein